MKILRKFFAVLAGALVLALCVPSAALLFHGGISTAGGGGGALALVRTFNQPSGTSTPASAFWMIGQPVPDGAMVASGNIVTATLGGTSVKVRGCEVKQHADGDVGWMWLLVDYSGQSITAGSSANLQLTSTSGSWSSSTTRTVSDWQGLVDTVQLTSLTTTGTSSSDMNGSGTWTASFNSNATVHTICTNDEGRIDEVVAPFINTSAVPPISLSTITWSSGTATFTTSSAHGITSGNVFQAQITGATPSGYNGNYPGCTSTGTTTFTCPLATNPGTETVPGTFQQAHRFLNARMFYWVTEKGDTTLGPIASLGPFIENEYILNTNASMFGYTVTFERNGTTIRQQTNVSQPIFSSSVLSRPDGQWDWSANDPKVWVSQDYTLVRATKKILPFMTGLAGNYVGGGTSGGTTAQPTVNVSAINTSTGVFTVSNIGALVSTSNSSWKNTAIEFNGTSAPTGLTFGQTYWACYTGGGGTTFKIYNDFADANNCTSTNQVIPSTSGSGVYAMMDAAPQTPGAIQPLLGDPGGRLDLAWQPEWSVGYLVGNTQAFQRMARVMGYAEWALPEWALNNATGCTHAFLPTALVPSSGSNCMGNAGMGAPFGLTLQWAYGPGGTSSYNGSTIPFTGGDGQFDLNDDDEHMPNMAYTIWLMEANPYMRELLYQLSSYAVARRSIVYGRNPQVAGTGTTYYGSFLTYCDPSVVRSCYWSMRDVSMAAFAAPTGSAEESYFKTLLSQTTSAMLAYQTYKGTNYTNLGLTTNDDTLGTATINSNSPYISTFMNMYGVISIGMATELEGDQVPNIGTINSYNAKLQVALYNTNCGYYATSYNIGASTSDIGAATPGAYVSSFSDLGYGGESTWAFSNGSTTITTTIGSNDNATSNAITIGSKYRPQNYNSDGGAANAAPSPFVDGTDYTLTSVSSPTFVTATTAGANATGVGGFMVPSSCPSTGSADGGTGTGGGNPASPDDYLSWQIMTLGVASATGVSGASTAYNAAVTRQNGPGVSLCYVEAMWCGQSGF